jgi:hypothetical protein
MRFGQTLIYSNFTIFNFDFWYNSLPSSIIYRRVFLNCLSVIVRGRSSTAVPPKTVLELTVAMLLSSACNFACGFGESLRPPRRAVWDRSWQSLQPCVIWELGLRWLWRISPAQSCVSTWISQVCWKVVAWTFRFVRSNLVQPFFIVILVILYW